METVEVVAIPKTDGKYGVNLITGEVFRIYKNDTSRKKKVENQTSSSKPYVILSINGRFRILYMFDCLLNLRYKHGFLGDTRPIGIYITKDNDNLNLHIDNMYVGDEFQKAYFKSISDDTFNNFIKNRISILKGDPLEFINKGLVPFKRIENSNYFIDTKGIRFNIKDSSFMKPRRNSYGYMAHTLKVHNKFHIYNVNRLLYKTFYNKKLNSDDVIAFKNIDQKRDSIGLDLIHCVTRSEHSKTFHKHHPEHANEYLNTLEVKSKSNVCKSIPVNLDGVRFESIRSAAIRLKDVTKKDTSITSIVSFISTILRNGGGTIYKKHNITKA